MTKWSELKKQVLSPDRIEKAHSKARRLVEDLELKELRKKLGKTQAELATTLTRKQASLSRMENQSDWMLSTLNRYLQGLGAKLRVFAEVEGTMYPLQLVEPGRKKKAKGHLPAIDASVQKDREKKTRRGHVKAAQ